MYIKIKKTSSKGKVFLSLILFSFLFGCSKDEILNNVSNTSSQTPNRKNASIELKVNPCSKAIMQQALQDLKRSSDLNEDRVYHYYQFNPERVTGEMLATIEQDENIQILDFPFADPKLYNEDMEETWEKTIAPLKDGNLYVVVNKNSPANNVFENPELGAKKLNELYLPQEDDSTLMERAYRLALDSSSRQKFFGIRFCFMKEGRGHVRYKDFATNTVRPVQGMKVFALVFGIPVNTHSDNNGYYKVPWRFNFGTFVGTHAQNHRANVKPLTLNGSTLGNIAQNTANFIFGSRHVEGWFGVCRIGDNDINIEFHHHNQVRLWAQILHSVSLHHNYCAQDGILPAPDGLNIYAIWGGSGPITRGSASMMKRVLHSNPDGVLAFGLRVGVSLIPQPFKSLLLANAPDITIPASPSNPNDVALMETDLHELAHASLFRRAGANWWVGLYIAALTYNNAVGGYGNIGDPHWGKTQVNESWATYLGREHHRRIHPNASISIRDFNNTPKTLSYNNEALEQMVYYTENNWIHPGIFHDLRDGVNLGIEANDKLSGYTIASMYNAFNSNTNSLCSWRNTFQAQNAVNMTLLNELMQQQNNWILNCP